MIYRKKKLIFFISMFLTILITYYIQKNSYFCSNFKILYENYTYVIVGAGTAGCILASKLSDNKSNTILLIEAGYEFNFISKIPPFSPLLQATSFDWNYLSTTQKSSSKGFIEKKQKIPRGKGFGGTFQINFMVNGKLEALDLENWDNLGMKNIKEYLPKNYYKLFNTSHSNSQLEPNKLFLSEMNWKLGRILNKAINKSQIPRLKFNKSYSSIYKGQRWTTYDSHLKPIIERKNLHVICGSEVVKILFSNKTATGVKIVSNGLNKVIKAHEIIISAGSINSPKLLLLSGIGDANTLNRLNINVIENVTAVGKNLHDHLNLPIYVSIRKPISLTLTKILSPKEIIYYLFYKTGLLSKSPIAGIAYSPSNFSIILTAMGSTDERIFKIIGNYRSEIFQKMFPYHNDFSKEGFVSLLTCAKPKSRGYVTLQDRNYKIPPLINPNYLRHKYDTECTKTAVKVLEDLIKTEPFRKIGAEIVWPDLEKCRKLKYSDKEAFIECIIRYCAMTGYHLAGTLSMGRSNEEKTVVDNKFRVKNVKNLRVIDASVLPSPVSTFPNSIIASLAEYGAELIISENKMSSKKLST